MLPGQSSPSSSSSSGSSSNSTASWQTWRSEMKRKVDLLTEELSLSRMKHAKMVRAATASRGQMIIEIPEFPLEFYQVVDQARCKSGIAPPKWFENFNKDLRIRKQPQAYHDWIQTRTVKLLPKVLSVIVNNLKEHPNRITGKDVLSSRLVGKSWKQSIDQFLQDSVSLELPSFHQKKPMIVATCIRSDNYKSVAEMLYFLEKNKHLQTLTAFPSGRLVIQYLPGMENQYEVAFNNGISTLLEFYGKNLQSFNYYDSRPELDISLVYHWLKKTPNLKSLEIRTHFSLSSQGGRGSLLAPNDFPHLPNLITVTLTGVGVPSKLTEQMISVNPRVRNLHFNSCHPQWSKLKQLSLTSLSIKVASVTQLQALADLQLPLEKLRLVNSINSDGLDVRDVCQFLERYEGTLKFLYLDLKVKDNESIWTLRLPHLQHLYLFLNRSTIEKKSYDYLLSLEFLEFLEIVIVPGEANEREIDSTHVIQLNGYFDRLYESNVWKLFPRLKRVDILEGLGGSPSHRHFIYTRDKLPEKRNEND